MRELGLTGPSQLASSRKGAASGEGWPKTKGNEGQLAGTDGAGGRGSGGSGGGRHVGLAVPSSLGSKLLFATQQEMGCNTTVLCGHFLQKRQYEVT